MKSVLVQYLLLAILFVPETGAQLGQCQYLEKPVSEKNVSEVIFVGNGLKSKGDMWDRPVKDGNGPIEISISVFIKSIVGIEEKHQLIRLTGYLSMRWQDELHPWNDTWPLSCVDYLVVPHGKDSGVWVPNVAIVNAAGSRFQVTYDEQENLRFYSDGSVLYSPGGIIEFYCAFNLAMFPFDTQSCWLLLEAWRYRTNAQVFTTKGIDLINLTQHQEWDIVGTGFKVGEVIYGGSRRYSTLSFKIVFRRKHGFYGLTVILPCLLIVAVEIVTFFLPFKQALRLEVSFTSLLAFFVFQSMVVSDLPKSAYHPPLLLIVISLLTIYIGIAIYLQSICMTMTKIGLYYNRLPPDWVLRLAKCGGSAIGRPGRRVSNESNSIAAGIRCMNNEQIERRERRLIIRNWDYVANILDKYSFLFFFVCLTTTLLVTLVILPAVNN